MKDYSICLIELQKAIKGYRQAILKNNEKKAIECCDEIVFWAAQLNNQTVENYINGD